LGLFAIAAAVGGRLLKAGGLSIDGSLEALLFWTATGLGVLATAIFTVGLLVGVRPAALLIPVAGAAFLARNELRQVPLLASDALSSLRASVDRFSLSICLIVAVFLVVGALAPPADWDALMYHLRVPQRFLQAGAIYLPEDTTLLGFVGLPHMLYLPLLAFRSSSAPALVSAVCTLGLALAVYALCVRFLDPRTGAFSLAVLWGSTVLIIVGITPRTDTILAFYLLLVHFALLRARELRDPRFLYLGAALAGMAVGVKYNALVYLLALAPLGLVVVVTRVRARAAVIALTVGFALVAALPWLLKNGLFLGDPLYPFLGGRKLDPWLAQLYAGHALPAALQRAAFELAGGAPVPFNLFDFFTAPARMTVEAEGVFYHPNFLLLFLPLWLLFLKDEILGWLGGPALVYGVLVAWMYPTPALLLKTTSLRYLIPAIPPLTVVALDCYGRVWDRLVSPKRVRLVLTATALAVLAGSATVMYRYAIKGREFAQLFGFVSRHEFLRRWTGDFPDVVSFVNGSVPPESRVLMLFEARGYYFRVPVLQDNMLMNWPLLSAHPAAHDCLRSTGITHVLLSRGALDYYRGHGFDLTPLRIESFEQFTDACLRPIYTGPSFSVFAVRAAPASWSTSP
jgi:hypothetical protein